MDILSKKFATPILLYLLLPLFLSACDSEKKPDNNILQVWFHTGRPEEKKVIEDQVLRFNNANDDLEVHLTLIPEGDYNTQVQSAAVAGKLPDLLDLDGPYLYNYIWKNKLIPIDDLIPATLKDNLLPTIIAQGTYRGKLYSVGTFDSGLGLYANRKLLQQAGINIPSGPIEAWTVNELQDILEKLADNDPDRMVLDLRLDYRGEWYTYAFSPVLQSAGGDLIDRKTFQQANGLLNNRYSISAMTSIQNWIIDGYVDPNTDASAFITGRVALSWCGHWVYPQYSQALGDDLLILPLPDFGRGSKTGMGSWNWAITKNCTNPKAAARFLRFLLQKNEVLVMSKANGAVPATKEAIKDSPLYSSSGPLHLFVQQLTSSAVPRPQSPAYPVITSAFQQAFQEIRDNDNVQHALNRATATIDQDIADNNGYQ